MKATAAGASERRVVHRVCPFCEATCGLAVEVRGDAIVSVRGERPTDLTYTGSAQPLLPLWIALRANVRRILEGVTVADIAADALPEPVRALAAEPAAWENP